MGRQLLTMGWGAPPAKEVLHLGQIVGSHSSWSRSLKADLFPMLYDLYGLAYVAGWEPYDLHDLLIAHVSWVGSVPYRSCTASDNGRVGSIWSRSCGTSSFRYIEDVNCRYIATWKAFRPPPSGILLFHADTERKQSTFSTMEWIPCSIDPRSVNTSEQHWKRFRGCWSCCSCSCCCGWCCCLC